MSSHPPHFSRLRSFFWPIYRHELKKLVPMLAIFFLTCFNYNILRNLKDTIVVTSTESGAAIIPFIKVYAVLPGAIITTLLFSYLSSRMSREKVVYCILSSFLAFFLLFAFVFYPNLETFHPTALAAALQKKAPVGLHGLIQVFSNWTFTLYYVSSELWGSLVLLVLFWGFVNEITSVEEATRFYAIFGVACNISNIFGGQAGLSLTLGSYNPAIPFGNTHWEQSVMLLNLLACAIILILMGIFWWINRYVVPDLPTNLQTTNTNNKKKLKMSFKDQFRLMMKNRYLMWVALIVLGYNITMNMVEVIWKNQLKLAYPSPTEFNIYMNNLSVYIGYAATFSGLFLSGQIIRKFGWMPSALVTPLLLFFSSSAFFFFLIFGEQVSGMTFALFSTTPLMLTVFFGGVQNCLVKACKYTFFDTTKELALIPLSSDLKLQGKAVIDGVGSRLGKSGGSLTLQMLLIFFSTLSASAPIASFIIMGFLLLWILSVFKTGHAFEELTSSQTVIPSPSDKPQSETAAST